mgnify:CR=1 FL=1
MLVNVRNTSFKLTIRNSSRVQQQGTTLLPTRDTAVSSEELGWKPECMDSR